MSHDGGCHHARPQHLKVSWRSEAGETATGTFARPIICSNAILYPTNDVILHY